VETAVLDILVIDDEPGVRRVASLILTAGGHHVVTASDAEQGLELIAKHAPDVIVCDVRLPGMSGVEMADRLHEDGRYAATRIVLMSAYGRPAGLPESKFVAKPFRASRLVRAVNAALESRT
jgi:CheY-like chemotaxis protein